ncbi:MAG: hypothetical protein ACPGXK_06625 [Phycisphaerae bacterium]
MKPSPSAKSAPCWMVCIALLTSATAGCNTAIDLPDVRIEFSLIGLFLDAADNIVNVDS